MARKPAKMYRQVKGPSYTRKKYMGGIPGLRINQFEVGNKTGNFPVTLSLVAENSCQIRHNCLEAARIAANRHISKRAGSALYHLKIRVYPHQVIRENKLATGAGADRISSGMRGAFGKIVGTAARVKSGQKIITIRTTVSHYQTAKKALWKACVKLPTPGYIVVDEGAELVG
ncbi:MAG TPA: 50S ribosomal protein L16 [Euryarchaeota archaeon]|nr:50S ribosomal protein L16 [Euryarchaeota archaeon]